MFLHQLPTEIAASILAQHLPPAYTTLFACTNRCYSQLTASHAALTRRRQITPARLFLRHMNMLQRAPPLFPHLLLYESHRPAILEWLLAIVMALHLHTEHYYHAMTLFDRYCEQQWQLCSKTSSENKLQLMGVVCLVLASKFHDDTPEFSLSSALFHCENIYTMKEAQAMELHVWQTLGYYVPTPNVWEIHAALAGICGSPQPQCALTDYLLQLGYLVPCNIGARPIDMLAAAFCLSAAMCGRHASASLAHVCDLCGCPRDKTKKRIIHMLSLFLRDLHQFSLGLPRASFQHYYIFAYSLPGPLVDSQPPPMALPLDALDVPERLELAEDIAELNKCKRHERIPLPDLFFFSALPLPLSTDGKDIAGSSIMQLQALL